MTLEKTAEMFNDVSGIPVAILSEDGIEAEYGIRAFAPSVAAFFTAPLLHKENKDPVDATIAEEQVMCGYVMEEAAYRLTASDEAIVDIAIGLGYSTQAYFTTVFKEIHGQTPAAFREAHR